MNAPKSNDIKSEEESEEEMNDVDESTSEQVEFISTTLNNLMSNTQ